MAEKWTCPLTGLTGVEGDNPIFAAKERESGSNAFSAAKIGTVPRERSIRSYSRGVAGR